MRLSKRAAKALKLTTVQDTHVHDLDGYASELEEAGYIERVTDKSVHYRATLLGREALAAL